MGRGASSSTYAISISPGSPQGLESATPSRFWRASQPGIKTVECNHLLEPASPPNDPNYPDQWHLINTGQIEPGGTEQCIPDFDINAPEAWQINSLAGSPIAILDDGINIANPDVAPYIAPSPISRSFVPPPNEWWEGG
ncbi:MAG: hypothetical protein IPK72_18975 [Candidatus Eisenbacteria bacterium]|nr:hypothetical protein [Candidatus Eisenbacteria bacterium]